MSICVIDVKDIPQKIQVNLIKSEIVQYFLSLISEIIIQGLITQIMKHMVLFLILNIK